MHILTLIHEFPPIGGGGGQAAKDLACSMAARGHKISIITSHFKDLELTTYEDGIQVNRLKSFRKDKFRAGIVSLFGFTLTAIIAGIKYIKNEKPDLIHAHFAVPAGAAGLIISWICGLKYIITAHLGDIPGGAPEKTKNWFRWIYPFTTIIWKRATKVVAVSKFSKELAEQYYPVDIDVIHNGVDLSIKPNIQVSVNDPVKIIFAGRLVQQKNPLQIIKTLSEIKHLRWDCTIIGDGILYVETEKEVIHQGLKNQIQFTGWITPDEVLQIITDSDILFMPSLSEGMPIIGVQALAAGLVLLVSDIGGFRDLVDHGENGYLVSQIEDYSRYLTKILDDPREIVRLKTNSRRKSQDFTMSNITDKYESCFMEIIKREDT